MQALRSVASAANSVRKSLPTYRGHSDAKPYGKTSLVLVLCSVMARLAYDTEKYFVTRYARIFDSPGKACFPDSLMGRIETALTTSTLEDLFSTPDTEIFNGDEFPPTDTPPVVAFKPFVAKVNQVTTEARIDKENANCANVIYDERPSNLVMVTVTTTNYGTVYVVGDKRAKHLMWVVFRGTYNAKTAKSYLQVASFMPSTISGFGYLQGIAKILFECIHAIVSAMVYVKNKLGADDKPISVICTGHSIGGGLATIFANVYTTTMVVPDGFYPHIACVSLGAPRIFSAESASVFCGNRQVIYRRMVNTNDPVPGLPWKVNGYAHPCAADKEAQQKVLTNCIVPVKNSNSHRCPAYNKSGKLFAMTADMSMPLACESDPAEISKRKGPVLGGPSITAQAAASGIFADIIARMPYHSIYLGVIYNGVINMFQPLECLDRLGKNTLVRFTHYSANDPDTLIVGFLDLTLQRESLQIGSFFNLADKLQEDVFNTPTFITSFLDSDKCVRSPIASTSAETPRKPHNVGEHNYDKESFWLKSDTIRNDTEIQVDDADPLMPEIQEQLNSHTNPIPLTYVEFKEKLKSLIPDATATFVDESGDSGAPVATAVPVGEAVPVGPVGKALGGSLQRTRNRRQLRRRKTFRKHNLKFDR